MRLLVKIVVFALVAVAIVAVLFTWVFPWVDENFVTDPTLEAQAALTHW